MGKISKHWITIPLSKLTSAPWNYKADNPELAEKLKNNIKRNGQIENIVIRELDTGFYEVVNGNHRLDVLKELKFKEVFAYNMGKITTQSAQRIAIELNESRYEADSIKLAETIREILTEYDIKDLEETTPYSLEDLGEMVKMLDFDWGNYNKGEREQKKMEEMRAITIEVEKKYYDDFVEGLTPLINEHKDHINIEWGFN